MLAIKIIIYLIIVIMLFLTSFTITQRAYKRIDLLEEQNKILKEIYKQLKEKTK